MNLTIGASNHSNRIREENDFYATEPKAINELLKVYKYFNSNIWECCCGKGHLSEELKKHSYNVYSSDLINRGYGKVESVFKKEYNNYDIITNPPFKIAEKIIEHLFKISENKVRICMLLKVQFLEGKKRKEFFKKYPMKYLYVSSSRIRTCKNGNFEKYKNVNSIAYAWYIWEVGNKEETKIRWFN